MPIKLGELDVANLMLGDVQVERVYLGEQEVWSACPAAYGERDATGGDPVQYLHNSPLSPGLRAGTVVLGGKQ